jgi:hypothetical protein
MNEVTVELPMVTKSTNTRRVRSDDRMRLVCFSHVVHNMFVHRTTTLSTGDQQFVPTLSGLVVHRRQGTEWGTHGW